MGRFVTFGEVMIRMSPTGMLRFRQSIPGRLELTLAGAEANVAASLATLGVDVRYVTALPKNPLAEAVMSQLNATSMDTRHVLQVDRGRVGICFIENGANQRPSQVVYDRENSAISLTPSSEYDWQSILADSHWLHVTGITPAISRNAADATIQAVQQAQALGVTVSCDLNFRTKLWRWDSNVAPQDLAGQVMRRVLPHVDLLIANEEDCQDVLGIQAGGSDVSAGRVDVSAYPDVARQVVQQFSSIRKVATTLRASISASHNNWGAMLYNAADDQAVFAPEASGEYAPYEIRNIVDRVGGGDAFAAGLMFALSSDAFSDDAAALRFATAASCLAHSTVGDFNFSTVDEIRTLMSGPGTGRVVR
ncbi:MAG TPA: sugar kinase [Pirellulales bacterium]|nr:sugar kinase [Pirellulales bacterium]